MIVKKTQRTPETVERICTICARGGSKGVPNKNIRLLNGRPLVAHSVRQALESNLFSIIAVSSDSDEILDAASKAGADILVRRPAEMATDIAPKVPVIQHCLLTVEQQLGRRFEVVVDLQATSPLRTADDIKAAINLLIESNAQNVITGVPSRNSPYFSIVELNDFGFVHLSKTLSNAVTRRQDAPPCYDMNGSIYVWRRDSLVEQECTVFLERTLLYVMPEERSIDIDTELDFQFVEFLMGSRT